MRTRAAEEEVLVKRWMKNYVVIRPKNNRIVESATAIGSIGVCMRRVEAKWRETSQKMNSTQGRVALTR